MAGASERKDGLQTALRGEQIETPVAGVSAVWMEPTECAEAV